MINLQKLEYLEHAFCIADNYTNQIKRIELDTKNFNALKDKLDGKYVKYMPTFWNRMVCEMWEDGGDVRVVRENSVEEYDERTINTTKWAGNYEDIPIKKSLVGDTVEKIKKRNIRFNERLSDEVENTMRIMARLKL